MGVRRERLEHLVDHLLLGDQMGAMTQHLHEVVDVLRPLVEDVVSRLRLGEVDHGEEAVHLGGDCTLGHDVG